VRLQIFAQLTLDRHHQNALVYRSAAMKRLTVLISALIVYGCASSKGPMAMAVMTPISGSTATGTAHFQELSDGSVDVTLDLRNVPPGVHGFHIHQNGDCGDNGNAAGGHFNPTNMPHAAPEAQSHHAGDFGNVTADASGVVSTSFNTRSITVHEGTASAVGHAVILHGNPDDLTTQPSGNAGPRIACGVVTLHTNMASSMQQ
jgi:Cu-Zn family superoxide dismutase